MDDATKEILRSFKEAREADDHDSSVFWLALAAAQMETGRLQDSVRDRALDVIAAGADLDRWEEAGYAKQRKRVIERLEKKLRGPQPKPKKLRRPQVHDVPFDRGVVVLVRAEGNRHALVAVVDQMEGYPKGATWPVVEFFAWSGSADELPAEAELRKMPFLQMVDDPKLRGLLGGDPNAVIGRPHLWVVSTHRKRDRFGPHIGEVVAKGIRRKPSGDPNQASAMAACGVSYASWKGLAAYAGGPRFEADLAFSREHSSSAGWLKGVLRRRSAE